MIRRLPLPPLRLAVRPSIALPAAIATLVLTGASAAPAGLVVSSPVTGSLTRGTGGSNLFAPSTAFVGPGEEFRGAIVRDPGAFGNVSVDGFADLSEDAIVLGFDRPTGSIGFSSSTPVTFRFTDLQFATPLTGVNTTVNSGEFSAPVPLM